MPTQTIPEGINDSELIRVINTGQRQPGEPSKMQAMAALRTSRSYRREQVFSSILADRQEQPRFRRMAVMGLYELGGARAERVLIEHWRNADEDIAPTIAQALGRIGTARAASVLRDIEALAPPAARARVAFAASLLAYRHNLDGNEIEVPKGDRLIGLAPDSESTEVRVIEPHYREKNLAMEAIRREPLGVSLTSQNGQQFECGPNTFVFLWNRSFPWRGLRGIIGRKGVAGVLFRKSRFEDKYSLSSVVLGTPDGNVYQLSVHNSSGEILYAGMMDLSAANGRFDIQACRRSGAVPIEFKGAIRNGQMVMESARSAVTVHNPRRPTRAPDIS